MKNTASLFPVIILLMAFVGAAAAKRAAPEAVAPVTHEGVTYSAAQSPVGLVEAVDATSGQVLWTKQIYVTRYDAALERDVQDRFITKLEIVDAGLLVSVEGGAVYLLDLKSLAVVERGKSDSGGKGAAPDAR